MTSFGTTGIRQATPQHSGHDAVYDLQGRKVNASTVNLKKGIYIRNGKKVLGRR